MGEVESLGRVLNQSLPKENSHYSDSTKGEQSLLRFYQRRTETVITQILLKENRNSQSLPRFYQRRIETDQVITQILPKENRNKVITQILPKENRNSHDSDSTKGEQKQS